MHAFVSIIIIIIIIKIIVIEIDAASDLQGHRRVMIKVSIASPKIIAV